MNRVNVTKLTVNGAKVINAEQLADQMDMKPDWYNGINSVYCPCGAMPGRGKFLISRSDYDAGFPDDTFDIDIEVKVTDNAGDVTTQSLTLKGYVAVSVYAALRSNNSPMIVEVADMRYLLQRRKIHEVFNKDFSPFEDTSSPGDPPDEDTNDTWENVLDKLKESLGAEGSDVEFATDPTYEPGELQYEGIGVITALADTASRTGHTVVYDPIAGKLSLSDMTGTQDGLMAVIEGEPVYREWEIPELAHTGDIGTVLVGFENGSTSEVVEETGGSGDNIATAWATRNTGVDGHDDESAALAKTWFDWASRNKAPKSNKYIGLLGAVCGSQVSMVRWSYAGGFIYTTISQSAPLQPKTIRRREVGASCITVQFRAGGLPAATNFQPGSAVADVIVLTGTPPTYKRNGQTETIYNWSNEILGDTGLRIGKAKREDGFWQVSATDCEDERPFVAAELIDGP